MRTTEQFDEPRSKRARTAESEEAKAKEDFRNYTDSDRQAIVEENYRLMHTNQSVEFVRGMHSKWLKLDHGEYSVFEVIEMLDCLVDDSDPDTSLPNSIHDFQTAERIREKFPGEEYDWFHLVGLLHDLGKVMALWGEPQWAVVGDTFPVGCKFSDKIVFPEQMQANPDASNPRYNTQLGIYEENCGLDKLMMSWGHDEYMYQVLVRNGCKIPPQGLAMIRFHSFYPWHTGEDYQSLTCEEDKEVLAWVREFNQFDLYSKSDSVPDVEELRPYYQGLIDKYCPGRLRF